MCNVEVVSWNAAHELTFQRKIYVDLYDLFTVIKLIIYFLIIFDPLACCDNLCPAKCYLLLHTLIPIFCSQYNICNLCVN